MASAAAPDLSLHRTDVSLQRLGHAWTMALMAGTVVCCRAVTARAVFDAIADPDVTHFGGAPIVLLGAVAACVGGAPVPVDAWRVTFCGALAMAITAGVGALFGTVV